MAETARANLKRALESGVSVTTGAVTNTLEVADVAVKKAGEVTKTAVNAAGVLGDETIKATETIGKAALGAGVTVGTTALEQGSQLSKVALEQGVKTSKAALEQGADVTAKTLEASATIANAATDATADISKTALETTASAVTTTTDQVGKALIAGVTLAGNAVRRTLEGVDNISAIVSGKGALVVQSTLQKQSATSMGIEAREGKDIKEKLLLTFEEVQKQMMTSFRTMHGVQKTALVGRINIYKRAKCGFFRRLTGFCDAGTISRDMKATDLFLNDFTRVLETAMPKARSAIAALTDASVASYRAIEINFFTECTKAADNFVKSYSDLLDKYDKLTRQALGMTGGRRKSYRKKRRSTRVSRRRPSVRGRSA